MRAFHVAKFGEEFPDTINQANASILSTDIEECREYRNNFIKNGQIIYLELNDSDLLQAATAGLKGDEYPIRVEVIDMMNYV